jgi:hypothetical protein
VNTVATHRVTGTWMVCMIIIYHLNAPVVVVQSAEAMGIQKIFAKTYIYNEVSFVRSFVAWLFTYLPLKQDT